MFKNETVAFAVVMVMVGSPATAAVDCTEYVRGYVNALNARPKDNDSIAQLKTAKEACEDRQLRQVGECKANAESEYTKAVTDLQNACDSMGLRSSTNSSIGCSYNVEQCRCATKGLNVTQKAYLNCDQVDTSKLKYCPEVTEAMKDRIEKRHDKADEKLEKAKEKLSGLDDEMAKIDDKTAEAKRQARKDRLAAEKEYSQGVAEMKTQKNQKEQERIKAMSELQDQMLPTQDALKAQPLKDRNAARSLETKKSQFYIQCVNTAQAAVNALQTNAVNDIRQGTYNRGTSNDIFRQVGLTDLQHWQLEVSKRVRKCMASPEIKAEQDDANRQLAADLEANKTEAESAQRKADEIKRKMDELQAACGAGAKAANGEIVQSQACRDQQDSQAKLDQLNESRKSALDGAAQDEKEADDANYTAKTAVRNKAGKLLGDINGQEDQLRNMDEADKVDASYPGNTTSAERAKLLSTKFAAAIDEAVQVSACCRRSNSSVNSQTCTSAKKFLNELGRTSPTDSTTDPSGTTRRSTSPGDADSDHTGAGAGV